MNVIVLSGNLGNDPDSRYSQEGVHVVTFSLAFSSGKNKTGWIKTTCFDKLADVAVKHLHKGAKVAVTGQIDQEKWTTENNENRTAIKLIGKTIDFIKTDGRGFDGTSNNGAKDDIPF
jgi:single-strand DNA-binding protein